MFGALRIYICSVEYDDSSIVGYTVGKYFLVPFIMFFQPRTESWEQLFVHRAGQEYLDQTSLYYCCTYLCDGCRHIIE